jgi:hypothetical protein
MPTSTQKATPNFAPLVDRRFLTEADSFAAIVFGRCVSFPVATTSSRNGRCPKNRYFPGRLVGAPPPEKFFRSLHFK